MITASDAILATAGLFGFGTAERRSDHAISPVDPDFELTPDPFVSPDWLSRGEPAFEAVAEALRTTGYLNA